MSEELVLKAEQRQLTGKKVKRLRREGWIPGVVYGPGLEPSSIQLLRKDLIEVYRQAGTSTLVGLLVKPQRKPRPALIRDVQQDPITYEVLHVDLEVVDMERPVTAEVPVVLVGEAPVAKDGLAVVTHGTEEIEIRALPSEVPGHIDVDVSVLTRPDQAIHVADLTFPEGILVLSDPETVLVYTSAVRLIEEEEVVEEVVEAAAAGAAAKEEPEEE